jgi:two-component system sensor histidine kinase DesK
VDLERMGNEPDRNPSGFYVWQILLVWPIRDVLGYDGVRAATAAGVLLVIMALYTGTVWSAFSAKVSMRVPVGLLLTLAAASVAAVLVFQGRWLTLIPMLGVACGTVLGHHVTRASEPLLVIGVGGMGGLGALVAWFAGRNGGDIFSTSYGSATAALVTAMMLRLIAVIGALRETRGELAAAAVAEERLRFSRDLHDLLGHTLSVMVVKAQAVRRVVERNPAVAAEQAADIETVGRQALKEVREAVTGYRGRGLVAELDAARTALADATIEATVRRAGPSLPPEADALLGWAVREGVTNVIRHSGARRCEIDVRHDGAVATVEICDDGTGGEPAGTAGHGLRGLTERMAAVGGMLTAGRRMDGGFRLTASVPLPS